MHTPRIICLEGPTAVGKTTLGAQLVAQYGAAVLPELDTSGAPPIAESAGWFVDRHAEQWRAARDRSAAAAFTVLDCDPLKGLWYNGMHASEGWKGIDVVAPLYRHHIGRGTLHFPELYIVLDATESQLRERRANDPTRRRRGFEKHVPMLSAQRRYFAALAAADPARVVVLDTADRATLVARVITAIRDARAPLVDPLELLEAMTDWVRRHASNRAEPLDVQAPTQR